MSETLDITDNRTGDKYEFGVDQGTIRCRDLRQIKQDDQEFGLMAYDPGFDNTAPCRSAITELKIARPRQIYTGAAKRDFVPLEERTRADR
jgi:citrate synthase